MSSGDRMRAQEHPTGGLWLGRRAGRGWLAVLVAALLLVPLGPQARGDAASGGGTWTATGSMTASRWLHTATLLPDGQVLVAGGEAGATGNALADAELYYPSTGTWMPTGSMITPRWGHTATLLPDGRVLVAGGLQCCDGGGGSYITLASAELYDPHTGTWTATGSMGTSRGYHTATLLPNGRVLVAGGYHYLNVYLRSAELYNSSTGTWAYTGSMATARDGHTATLLPNGQALVAGGQNRADRLSSAEVYAPSTGTWTPTGSMTSARDAHTATLLPSGQVLVAGGCCEGPNPLASAELYNPSTDTWTPTGSMTAGHESPTATLLPIGQVLVAGGYPGIASAELYDPSTGTWTPTGSMTTGRNGHTATLLPDGQVLASGGVSCTSSCTTVSSAELYFPPQPSTTLTLTPTSGFYKEALVITGTNFAPNEIVNIYADMTTTAPIYTTQAGPDGSFVLHTTVLQGPYGSHTLIGVGRHSGRSATATFFETPRLIMTPNSGTVGSTITAHGYGFGAGETVQVFWRNPKQLLGSTTTNSYGTFSGSSAVTFTIPSGAPPGANIVYGVGQSTHAIGDGTVTVH